MPSQRSRSRSRRGTWDPGSPSKGLETNCYGASHPHNCVWAEARSQHGTHARRSGDEAPQWRQGRDEAAKRRQRRSARVRGCVVRCGFLAPAPIFRGQGAWDEPLNGEVGAQRSKVHAHARVRRASVSRRTLARGPCLSRAQARSTHTPRWSTNCVLALTPPRACALLLASAHTHIPTVYAQMQKRSCNHAASHAQQHALCHLQPMQKAGLQLA